MELPRDTFVRQLVHDAQQNGLALRRRRRRERRPVAPAEPRPLALVNTLQPVVGAGDAQAHPGTCVDAFVFGVGCGERSSRCRTARRGRSVGEGRLAPRCFAAYAGTGASSSSSAETCALRNITNAATAPTAANATSATKAQW
jgi:hypothetical protein